MIQRSRRCSVCPPFFFRSEKRNQTIESREFIEQRRVAVLVSLLLERCSMESFMRGHVPTYTPIGSRTVFRETREYGVKSARSKNRTKGAARIGPRHFTLSSIRGTFSHHQLFFPYRRRFIVASSSSSLSDTRVVYFESEARVDLSTALWG